ncbi:LamG domain-containing protein [Paenibacillus sp. SYP-B3998]|uniref:LamG domain-containing protein n=1 Tax=Paenibacillus sp. SYP-B3998 TaxID=2678564 RepID=A0A6G3ZSZ1_9BACL|nr:LamG domain-containing protein [Paenibacillus sp. SYP-B3998]NEW04709.1 LamG domain-containing protein [Paenibacillus sp. SYP-B3998]
MYLKLGEHGYVECGGRPELSFEGFRNYTFAAWIRMNEHGQGGTLWAKSDSVSDVEYLVYIDGNTRKVNAYRNVEDWVAVSETILQPNQWYHIATTYEAPISGPWPQRFPSRLYINGVLEGEMYSTSIPGYKHSPFMIGAGYNANGQHASFGGDIRELRVWDAALTKEEIRQEMESSVPIHQGIVSWFNFQKATGPQEAGVHLGGGASLFDDSPMITLSNQSQITQHYWTSFYEPLTEAESNQIVGEIEPDGSLAFYTSLSNPIQPEANGLTFRIREESNGTGWMEENLHIPAISTKLYYSKNSGSEGHELVTLGQTTNNLRELAVWSVHHQEGTVSKRVSTLINSKFEQLYSHTHEGSHQTIVYLYAEQLRRLIGYDMESMRYFEMILNEELGSFIERQEPEYYVEPKQGISPDFYYLSKQGRLYAILELNNAPDIILDQAQILLPCQGIRSGAVIEDYEQNIHMFMIDSNGQLQYGKGKFEQFMHHPDQTSWTPLFDRTFKSVQGAIVDKRIELFLTTETDELQYASYDFAEWELPAYVGVPCSSLIVCPSWNGETNLLALKEKEIHRVRRNRNTGYWSSDRIRLEAKVKAAQEFLSYSTQIFVVDQDDNPLANEMIEIEAEKDTLLLVNQKRHLLRSGGKLTVPTLMDGTISIILQAESLYTFALKARPVRRPEVEMVIDPHQDIKRRLSALTTDDLMQAKENGVYLVPDQYRNTEALQQVVQGVQNCITIANQPPSANIASNTRLHGEIQSLENSFPFVVFDFTNMTSNEFSNIPLATRNETNLLGGFWDWIWSAGQFVASVVKKAVQVTKMIVEKVVDAVKATFTAIVDGIKRSIQVVFEHVGQVVDAIAGIFNTIGVKAKQLIQYVADKIGWSDIIKAKDTYKSYLTGYFDSMGTMIEVFQDKADYLWKTLDDYRAEGFRKLKEQPYYANTNKLKEEQSKYKLIQRDNRFALIMNPLMGMLGTNNEQINPNERWNDVNSDLQADTLSDSGATILDKLKSSIKEIKEDSSFEDLKSRVSQIASNPSRLYTEGVSLLVDITDLILSATVKGAKVATNVLFDVLRDIVGALADVLKMELQIPVVSDLYEFITGSKLTLIDLLSLVMAICLNIFDGLFNISVNYDKMFQLRDKFTKSYFSNGVRGIQSVNTTQVDPIEELDQDLIQINKYMQVGGFAWITISDTVSLLSSMVKVGRINKFSKKPMDTSKYPNWNNMTQSERTKAKLKQISEDMNQDSTMGAFDFLNLFFSFAPLLRTALIPPVWFSEFGKEWRRGWANAAGICIWGLQTIFALGSVLCGSIWIIVSKAMKYFNVNLRGGLRAFTDKISPYVVIFFQVLTTLSSLSFAIISCCAPKDSNNNPNGVAIANNFVIFASYGFGTTATILGLSKSNIYVAAAAAACTGLMVLSDGTSLGLTAAQL